MTFITWVAYVQKTYTKQVWSIVYLLLGFVRTSYTINEWLHTFFCLILSLKESNGATLLITMNGLDFIKSKQQSWAKRKGFNVVGGTIPNRGEANYLPNLTDNLFEPLSKGNLLSYQKGDGNETKDSKTRLAK